MGTELAKARAAAEDHDDPLYQSSGSTNRDLTSVFRAPLCCGMAAHAAHVSTAAGTLFHAFPLPKLQHAYSNTRKIEMKYSEHLTGFLFPLAAAPPVQLKSWALASTRTSRFRLRHAAPKSASNTMCAWLCCQPCRCQATWLSPGTNLLMQYEVARSDSNLERGQDIIGQERSITTATTSQLCTTDMPGERAKAC